MVSVVRHDVNQAMGISLEEVIIALRDEKHMLVPMEEGDRSEMQEYSTFYPDGFSLARFVELVENGEIWQ